MTDTPEERQAAQLVQALTAEADDPGKVLSAFLGAAISEARSRWGASDTIDALNRFMSALGKQVN
ncbi:MAG: hypothetical protein AAF264_04020 [Pseudomonadota bacterium]